jgi:hypothetical protein
VASDRGASAAPLLRHSTRRGERTSGCAEDPFERVGVCGDHADGPRSRGVQRVRFVLVDGVDDRIGEAQGQYWSSLSAVIISLFGGSSDCAG